MTSQMQNTKLVRLPDFCRTMTSSRTLSDRLNAKTSIGTSVSFVTGTIACALRFFFDNKARLIDELNRRSMEPSSFLAGKLF
jgi:hypothetical protein